MDSGGSGAVRVYTGAVDFTMHDAARLGETEIVAAQGERAGAAFYGAANGSVRRGSCRRLGIDAPSY